jgi:membrane protease YdiL (CAAX protease family)
VTCEQVGVAIPAAKSKVIAFHLQRFARAWVAGICLVVAVPCMAQAVRPISLDDLRTPSRAAELVSDSQYDAYRDVQRAYAQQETANPNDSALVIAQCQFIESFTDNDDLTWDDDAQTDFQACKKQLEDRFHGDPEASLYVAEHRYGKPVLDFAIPLLPASEHWTVQQRMRLHGVLSGAYTATHQSDLAGQEALTSVRLDPGSAQLTAALRYLCDAGRRSEAESLLAKAPLPTSAWIEEQRVRFAADSLSPATALAELQRADSAGQKTDPWIAARIYLRAGMNAKAADALSKVKIKPAYQTVAQYQLRVDVAAVQKDGNAASAAFHDWFSKTGITAPLLSAYGMLLAHDPLQLFAPTLAPFALAMFAMLVFLACLPGVIAFPAHYRGIVRARLNKPLQPLFAPIGLRHMWLALGAFLVVSTLVPMLGSGSALQSLGANRPLSPGEEATALAIQLAMLAGGALFLIPAARHLSWRAWLGDRGWKVALITVVAWSLLKVLVVWAATHTGHLGETLRGTPHDQRVAALAVAASHLGGVAFAMLIVAVLVPIYEELVFRCFILGGLSRHLSFGWANTWQALLFALIHFDLPHFAFYFLLGLFGGWLVRRTRGLAASIALHAANNAIACAAILLSG